MVELRDSVDLVAAYKLRYPQHDEGELWMAGEFARQFADIQSHVQFYVQWLSTASGLSEGEKRARTPPQKKKGTDIAIMELCHSLRRADLMFDDLTQEQAATTQELAIRGS